MRLVQLTQLIRTEEGEDDAINQVTRPLWVNPELVRSVRPRNEGPGTRVEYARGAHIVHEPVDEVMAMLSAPRTVA